MRRKLSQLIFFGLILMVPAWAAQQGPPPAPPAPPSPEPQSKAQAPKQESTADIPASAEEDIEVASYYIRKGDPDAAIPRLKEAIQLRPKLAKPRLMLAEVYEKKGDAPKAVRCYKEYLQVFPSAPDAKKIEKKIEKLTNR